MDLPCERSALLWFLLVVSALLHADAQISPSVYQPIGVQNNTIIPGGLMTASSQVNGSEAYRGRLNGDGAWQPSGQGTEFLAVDLEYNRYIFGIQTQGQGVGYVETYRILYQVDNTTDLVLYSAGGGSATIFSGNSDNETIVQQNFPSYIYARYILVNPQDFSGAPRLRIELLGVDDLPTTISPVTTPLVTTPSTPSSTQPQSTTEAVTSSGVYQPIGVQDVTIIPDNLMTASSQVNGSEAYRGRLNGDGAWQPSRQGTEFLAVDLEYNRYIFGIQTQGQGDGYVETYRILYQVDNTTDLILYSAGGGTAKIFSGNSDNETIVQQNFTSYIYARYILVNPQTWLGAPRLRIELLGVDALPTTSSPVTTPPVTTTSSQTTPPVTTTSTQTTPIVTTSSPVTTPPIQTTSPVTTPPIQTTSPVTTPPIQTTSPVTTPIIQTTAPVTTTVTEIPTTSSLTTTIGPSTSPVTTPLGTTTRLTTNQVDTTKLSTSSSTQLPQTSFSSDVPTTTPSVDAETTTNQGQSTSSNIFSSTQTQTAASATEAETSSGVYQPIGVQDDTIITDDLMTASSQVNGSEAYRGRLNGDGAWQPSGQGTEFLAVDLEYNRYIFGIQTQGQGDGYVETYRILYQVDNTTDLVLYSAGGGTAKIFNGNSDNETIVQQNFTSYIYARYILVNPQTWSGAPRLRIELLGVDVLPTTSSPVTTPPVTTTSTQTTPPVTTTSTQMTPPVTTTSSLTTPIGPTTSPVTTPLDTTTSLTTNQVDTTKLSTSSSTQLPQTSFSSDVPTTTLVVDTESTTNQGQSTASNIFSSTETQTAASATEAETSSGVYQPIGVQDDTIIPDNLMTASSQVSGSEAYRGRLNGDGAWQPSGQGTEFLAVDLEYNRYIFGIQTQGQGNGYVETYRILYQVDNTTDLVLYSAGGGTAKIFSGNSDNETIVQQNFTSYIYARYILVNPQTWSGAPRLRIELLGVDELPTTISPVTTPLVTTPSTPSSTQPQSTTEAVTSSGVYQPIGVQDVTIIPDNLMTASSQVSGSEAYRGRLNGDGAWQPSGQGTEFLAVDLEYNRYIFGIQTQGQGNGYVETYRILYQVDNTTDLILYSAGGGTAKIFNGNSDNETIVQQNFTSYIYARYILVNPQTWLGAPRLRIELLGVDELPTTISPVTTPLVTTLSTPSSTQPQSTTEAETSSGVYQPIGVQDDTIIPDDLMTASSQVSGSEAYRARLNGDGAWQPSGQGTNEFLAVDLQYNRYIFGIQTQGQGNGYVETYSVIYQVDNTTNLVGYSEDGGSAKIFSGNSDNETIVQQNFTSYIYARYILVNPKTFSGARRLRIELLGVDALPTTSSPVTTPPVTTSSTQTTPPVTTTSTQTTPIMTTSSPVTTPLIPTTSPVTTTATEIPTTSSLTTTIGPMTSPVTTPIGTTTSLTTNQVDTTKLSTSSTQLPQTSFSSDVPTTTPSVDAESTTNQGQTTASNIFSSAQTQTAASTMGSETSSGVYQPIGVQDVTIIPDDLMTASSQVSGSEAYRGRLNGDGAWQPSGQGTNEFLAVDLQYNRYIFGIQTQGQGNGYVETYSVIYQVDNTTNLVGYSEDGGSAKIFSGNSDNETIVQQNFTSYIYARYILVNPKTFSGARRLRIELLGVDALPTTSSQVTTPPVTTSSTQTTPIVTTSSPVTTPLIQTTSPVTTPLIPTTSPVTTTATEIPTTSSLTTTIGPMTSPVTTPIGTTTSLTTNQVDTTKLSTSSTQLPQTSFSSDVPTTTPSVDAETTTNQGQSTSSNMFSSTQTQTAASTTGSKTPSGVYQPIGVQDVTIIPDDLMTASSQVSGSEAYRARLNGDGAWQPAGQGTNEFLAVDLQYNRYIFGIQTQGQGNGYVETYSVIYQVDNTTNLVGYSEDGGSAKIFSGNSDNETIVQQNFTSYIHARYILVNPQTWSGAPRLRIELLGVDELPTTISPVTTPLVTTLPTPSLTQPQSTTEAGTSSGVYQPIGVQDDTIIPDGLMTASSQVSGSEAYRGRLNGDGAWQPAGQGTNEFLAVDLQYNRYIFGIQTQGQGNGYVETYSVIYQVDNTTNLVGYSEDGGSAKIFSGNNDRETIVQQNFTSYIYARYILVNPKTFSGAPRLRIELLGVDELPTTSSPVTTPPMTTSSAVTTSSPLVTTQATTSSPLVTTQATTSSLVTTTNPSTQTLSVETTSVIEESTVMEEQTTDMLTATSESTTVETSTASIAPSGTTVETTTTAASTPETPTEEPQTSVDTSTLQTSMFPTDAGASTESQTQGQVFTSPLSISTTSTDDMITSTIISTQGQDVTTQTLSTMAQPDTTALVDVTVYTTVISATDGTTTEKLEMTTSASDQLSTLIEVTTAEILDQSTPVPTVSATTPTTPTSSTATSEVSVSASTASTAAPTVPSAAPTVTSAAPTVSTPAPAVSTSIPTSVVASTATQVATTIKPTQEFVVVIQSLGLSDETIISNDQISASSSIEGFESFEGRLNNEGAWQFNASDPSPFLQVDLGSVTTVTTIQTQGYTDGFVFSYTLAYQQVTQTGRRRRQVNFVDYMENGTVRVFEGNNDGNTVVEQNLTTPIVTQSLRIKPTNFSETPQLRVGLIGEVSVPITVTTGAAPTTTVEQTIITTRGLADWQLYAIVGGSSAGAVLLLMAIIGLSVARSRKTKKSRSARFTKGHSAWSNVDARNISTSGSIPTESYKIPRARSSYKPRDETYSSVHYNDAYRSDDESLPPHIDDTKSPVVGHNGDYASHAVMIDTRAPGGTKLQY
ncbi:mucin-17-like [Branchiostoma floridae]|uniref:Mucin-17-like n=1 Tax=Branchiostoma floridae TaxID=7739 RepID=A0A9J7MFD6_BRAFL|nr:mucin-17-like [Branchiostoma floridae]